MPRQRDERDGCALLWTLVEEPPQKHAEVHEVQHAAERFSQWPLWRIAGSDNSVVEHPLHTLPGERGSRREYPIIRVANEHRNQRAEGNTVWLAWER